MTTNELVAREIMSTPVAAVTDEATVWEAWNVLIRDHIRHVVVVNGRHCIGVVTESDLVAAWNRGPAVLSTMPIRTLLLNRTACVLPDAPVRHVAAVMDAERVDAVPVVDEQGTVLGLITATDVIHAVASDGIIRGHHGE